MPYTSGRGDYYTGDNYAAGGLSLKKLVKGVGKVVGGALKLTPAGRVISTAIDLYRGASKPQLPSFNVQRPLPMDPVIDYSGGGMDVNVPADAAIPAYGNDYIYDSRGRRKGDTGRKGHFKKDGTWTNRARPRMNPTNFRALRRASRRAHSFLRIARSAVRYFTPKAPKGKAYVAFRKKAR